MSVNGTIWVSVEIKYMADSMETFKKQIMKDPPYRNIVGVGVGGVSYDIRTTGKVKLPDSIGMVSGKSSRRNR